MRNFVSEFMRENDLDCTDAIFYFEDDKFKLAVTVSDLLLKDEYAYILNDIMRGAKFISATAEDFQTFLNELYLK